MSVTFQGEKRPIIRGLSRESESIRMSQPGRVGVENDDLLGVVSNFIFLLMIDESSFNL